MQPVLNIEDVKSVEKSLATVGVSVSELMHRAGAAVAQEVLALPEVASAAVLVGFGNNGGDGWVAASALKDAGLNIVVVSPVAPAEFASDLARVVAHSATENGVEVVLAPSANDLDELLSGVDVVIDAIFGTGFHGSPAAPFNIWIERANMCGARIVAVDVPSGLSAQTGHTAGECIQADITVTMLSLKPGLLADEARDVCGSIVVAPLAQQTTDLVYKADPVAWRAEGMDYLNVIAPPTFCVDKYSRGTVLVVAGSARFPGAALMCAQAASRAGAGYVTLAVPAPLVPMMQMQAPHLQVVGLPSDDKGCFTEDAAPIASKLADKSSVVVVGPGMGVSAASSAIVTSLLETSAPVVVDADGLNNLARMTMNRLDNFPELIRRTAPLILTPHARELGRLMGLPGTPPDSLTSCMEAARRIVWSNGGSECVVVAKGSATACVGVDLAILPKPGPACLASAGTGDVLAGIMGGVLAHNPVPTSELPLLASYACEIHGVAANIAAKRYGSQGVIAPDLIKEIGPAIDAMIARSTYAFENEE